MAVGQTTAKHAGPATDVSIVSIRRSTKLIDGGERPQNKQGVAGGPRQPARTQFTKEGSQSSSTVISYWSMIPSAVDSVRRYVPTLRKLRQSV